MYPRDSYLAAFSPVNPSPSPQLPDTIDKSCELDMKRSVEISVQCMADDMYKLECVSGSQKKLTANVSSL